MSSHLPLFGTCTAHVRRRPWRAVSCVPTIALVGIMSNAGASTLQGRPESEILSCTALNPGSVANAHSAGRHEQRVRILAGSQRRNFF
eukprot:156399-Prorocentrum_minimum.AAC.5